MIWSCIRGVVRANVHILALLGTQQFIWFLSGLTSEISYLRTTFTLTNISHASLWYYITLTHAHANIRKTITPLFLQVLESLWTSFHICVEALRSHWSIPAIIQWSSFSMWLINIRIHLLTSRCMFLWASAEPIQQTVTASDKKHSATLQQPK